MRPLSPALRSLTIARLGARLGACLGACLCLASIAGAAGHPPAGDPAASAGGPSAALAVASAAPAPVGDIAAAVRVDAWLELGGDRLPQGGRLALAGPATLVIEVTAPADAQVFVPESPAIDPFRQLGAPAPVERQAVGPRVREVHRLPVLPLRVGAKAVPAMDITYRLPNGTAGTARTPRLRVTIDGRLVNDQDPALGPAPAPVPVITTNWALVWTLSILGAVALAVLVTLLVLRLLKDRLAALVPPPPPRPANAVALDKLDLLQISDLEPAPLLAATTDVLRGYLGGRYRFDALEMTTWEVRQSLVGADLKGILPAEIDGLLDEADLVKFARLAPGRDEARARIDDVRRVVVTTWEEIEEEDEEQEPTAPVEPAPLAERLKAALLDGLLAAAACLVSLGALWASGALAWSWTALVLGGVLLVTRDLMGTASPGKALRGLRIVRREARHVDAGAGQRLLRNLLLLVAPLGVPIEALVLVQHPLRLRVGDAWAGTEVVRDLARRGEA